MEEDQEKARAGMTVRGDDSRRGGASGHRSFGSDASTRGQASEPRTRAIASVLEELDAALGVQRCMEPYSASVLRRM